MEWRKSYHLPYVSNTVNGKIDKLGPGKLRVKVICDSLVKHGRADLQFRQTELDISLLVNAKDATVTDVQPRPAVGVTTRSQSSKHSLAGTSTGSVNASKNKGWDVGGGAAASQTTPLHLDVRHTRGGTAGHTLSLEASQAQESNQDWSRTVEHWRIGRADLGSSMDYKTVLPEAVRADGRGNWMTEFEPTLRHLPFRELTQDTAAKGTLHADVWFDIQLPEDTQQLQLQLSIFHGIQMAVSTQAVAAVHSGYLDWQARYKRVLELISGQELGLADAILTASELPDSKATVKAAWEDYISSYPHSGTSHCPVGLLEVDVDLQSRSATASSSHSDIEHMNVVYLDHHDCLDLWVTHNEEAVKALHAGIQERLATAQVPIRKRRRSPIPTSWPRRRASSGSSSESSDCNRELGELCKIFNVIRRNCDFSR